MIFFLQGMTSSSRHTILPLKSQFDMNKLDSATPTNLFSHMTTARGVLLCTDWAWKWSCLYHSKIRRAVSYWGPKYIWYLKTGAFFRPLIRNNRLHLKQISPLSRGMWTTSFCSEFVTIPYFHKINSTFHINIHCCAYNTQLHITAKLNLPGLSLQKYTMNVLLSYLYPVLHIKNLKKTAWTSWAKHCWQNLPHHIIFPLLDPTFMPNVTSWCIALICKIVQRPLASYSLDLLHSKHCHWTSNCNKVMAYLFQWGNCTIQWLFISHLFSFGIDCLLQLERFLLMDNGVCLCVVSPFCSNRVNVFMFFCVCMLWAVANIFICCV